MDKTVDISNNTFDSLVYLYERDEDNNEFMDKVGIYADAKTPKYKANINSIHFKKWLSSEISRALRSQSNFERLAEKFTYLVTDHHFKNKRISKMFQRDGL